MNITDILESGIDIYDIDPNEIIKLATSID